jgi:hypothetical protein
MRLNAPKNVTFFISVALLVVGLITFLVPDFSVGISFILALIGGGLLALGCLLTGL